MAWALVAALEVDILQVEPCLGVACAVEEAVGSCGCSPEVGRLELVEEG